MNRIPFISIVLTMVVTSFPSIVGAALSTPAEAVHTGLNGKEGVTDIDGDGLHVMPVKVNHQGTKMTISGQIRHTWRNYDSTPIDFEINVDGGVVVGTITVTKKDNPDGEAIGTTRHGRLLGDVKSVKCDILMEHRVMRGAVKLIGLIVQEADRKSR